MVGQKPKYDVFVEKFGAQKGDKYSLFKCGAAWENDKCISIIMEAPVCAGKIVLLPRKEAE